jgi:pyruvate/2-oxoglutarate dehydrogenase complex dihydrolipoamide acyltransferase (E2) component
MKQEIKLPEIADNVVSGFLARILVKVGDVIEKDQSIIEIETDKAATDIPTPIGGKVIDIKVNAGDEIRVGQTILVLELGGEVTDVKDVKNVKSVKNVKIEALVQAEADRSHPGESRDPVPYRDCHYEHTLFRISGAGIAIGAAVCAGAGA